MNNKLIWVYVALGVVIIGGIIFYMLNSAKALKITASVNPFSTYKK